jgi:hypothetical protein
MVFARTFGARSFACREISFLLQPGEQVRFRAAWYRVVGVKADWHTVQVFEAGSVRFACPAQVLEQ